MGLENVVNDILEQAKAEVLIIKKETEGEVAAIIDEAKANAEKIMEAKQAQTNAQIDRIEKQEMSSAHLEIKRATLNAKKDVMESVYQSAREKISSIPAEKNANLLKEILDNYGSNGSRVYSNGRDAKLVQEMTDLTYMGEIECLGGLVIENEDGSVRLDYTFDTILENASEQSLKHISDILFG